jgi:hypothetical protein
MNMRRIPLLILPWMVVYLAGCATPSPSEPTSPILFAFNWSTQPAIMADNQFLYAKPPGMRQPGEHYLANKTGQYTLATASGRTIDMRKETAANGVKFNLSYLQNNRLIQPGSCLVVRGAHPTTRSRYPVAWTSKPFRVDFLEEDRRLSHEIDQLDRSRQNHERELAALEQRHTEARRLLEDPARYAQGVCLKPPEPVLPAKPAAACSAQEADALVGASCGAALASWGDCQALVAALGDSGAHLNIDRFESGCRQPERIQAIQVDRGFWVSMAQTAIANPYENGCRDLVPGYCKNLARLYESKRASLLSPLLGKCAETVQGHCASQYAAWTREVERLRAMPRERLAECGSAVAVARDYATRRAAHLAAIEESSTRARALTAQRSSLANRGPVAVTEGGC